ncbi:sensor domain-containing diguanylate cyclase [Pseudomonas abieticivorans]|uniref:sensor domain-containing diguanylate cyclase n=1 Tax=Pseudomonas abieticivorans TaxID=2931382 RepID=UPI0020BF22C3|nr:sensor domain-containing diguanylate cyclase [Pseudomonas sp. PIA16]
MKRDLRLASLLTLLVCATVALLTGWQIWTARENTLSNIEVDTLNLTQALNTYTDGMFKQSELVLIALAQIAESEGVGPPQRERLQRLIAQDMSALPQLNSVVLYDDKGNWVLSNSALRPADSNGNDREFFIHHRDHPDRGVFIGPTIRSKATNAWVISVSRRLEHADGRFAGVIAVTISLEHFLKLYQSIQVGKLGAISLTTSSGQVLVRYPFREQDIGRDLSSAPIFNDDLRQARSGTTRFASKVDGIKRLYAFKKSDQYPLVTTVAQGQAEAMQGWWDQSQKLLGVVLLLLALLVALGQRLKTHINYRIKAELQLRKSQSSLLALNDELEVLASVDKLTGLANRRHFDEFLDSELKRARRTESPLSLLLIDVDFFKLYNDTYGHIAGDQCLQQVSQIISACARRPGDRVARYGGEEIAIVMPNTDGPGCHSVARCILQAIVEAGIAHAQSPLGVITVSIGAATCVAPYGEPQALIEIADRALYQAKAEGRNRLSAL